MHCALDEPGIYHPVKQSVLEPDDLAAGVGRALERMTTKAAMQRLRADYPWPNKPPSVPLDFANGWLDASTAGLLASSLSPDTSLVVEMGSWLGLSTRFIAERAPRANVVAIDHWRGSAEHVASPECAAMLPALYDTFLANCWHHRERIYPLRMPTLDGLRVLHGRGLKPDVAYVDADHSYDGVAGDLRCLLSCFPETTIVGDDWNQFPSVRQAVTDVAASFGVRVETSGNAYRIQGRRRGK
ncbi:MAG: class I SAM-dependent methyltransferase [Pirellulales bacterium]